jgi:hypothetical protein
MKHLKTEWLYALAALLTALNGFIALFVRHQ